MIAKPILKNFSKRWIESISAKAAEWSAQSGATAGLRSSHFWIITVLIALGMLIYYVEQTPLVSVPPFNHSFFIGPHDLQRTLFLIPVVYAAFVFKVRGSLITSFILLCVVLPRALLFSSYPDPLFRPLIFVALTALISLLIATQLSRAEM